MGCLHWACRRGVTGIVAALLELPGLNLAESDNYGFTALMWASCKAAVESAELLLDSGRELALGAVDRESGFSALHWAVNKSCLPLIGRLASQGADVNAKCRRHMTPLHWACVAGDLLAVRALLDAAVDPSPADDGGVTALHLAAMKEPEIVRLLVQLNVNVNARTAEHGSSALHEAAAEGKVECARLLLGAGATVSAANNEGKTPLHHAALYGHVGVVRLLLDSAAVVDARTIDGVTPLMLAAFNNHAEIVSVLAGKGAVVDALNGNRSSALHVASYKGHADAVTALLAAGASYALANAKGDTPLHFACQNGHTAAARVIVKAGANALAKNAAGETPVTLCTRNGDSKLAKYLTEKASTRGPGDAPAATPNPAAAQGAAKPGGAVFAAEASAAASAPVFAPSTWEVPFSELVFKKPIGKGSYGEVYVGDWRGTVVAIKQFSVRAMNERNRALFQAEVDVMARLRHPNIVLFMGACTDMVNPLCIITEFVAGGSLFHALCDRNRPMTYMNKLTLACDIARAMNYLHCSDPVIMHRDLKSLNVLVDENWTAKVCDFGLTKVKQTAWVQTRCGTPHYMSPQVLLRENYDEKADVFAYGIILWEILTRQQPYAKMPAMEVARRVVQTGMRPPIPPKTVPAFERLMSACWEQEPTARPSFGDAINVLTGMLAEAAAAGERR